VSCPANLPRERQSSDAAGESRRRKRGLNGREIHDWSDLPLDWPQDANLSLEVTVAFALRVAVEHPMEDELEICGIDGQRLIETTRETTSNVPSGTTKDVM